MEDVVEACSSRRPKKSSAKQIQYNIPRLLRKCVELKQECTAELADANTNLKQLEDDVQVIEDITELNDCIKKINSYQATDAQAKVAFLLRKRNSGLCVLQHQMLWKRNWIPGNGTWEDHAKITWRRIGVKPLRRFAELCHEFDALPYFLQAVETENHEITWTQLVKMFTRIQLGIQQLNQPSKSLQNEQGNSL